MAVILAIVLWSRAMRMRSEQRSEKGCRSAADKALMIGQEIEVTSTPRGIKDEIPKNLLFIGAMQ